jgi:hypothetical protein
LDCQTNIWRLENWNRKNYQITNYTIIYKFHDYKFHACSMLIVEKIRRVFNSFFLFSFQKTSVSQYGIKVLCLVHNYSLHKLLHNFQFSYNALKSLYIAIVRSRFGYCSQLWAPQSVIRNIFLLESVQRRSTKFICGYTEANYRDRLVQLKLLPVSY